MTAAEIATRLHVMTAPQRRIIGGVTAALVSRYREREQEMRADPEAVAWGGLRREVAIEVLGADATPERVDALLAAVRAAP